MNNRLKKTFGGCRDTSSEQPNGGQYRRLQHHWKHRMLLHPHYRIRSGDDLGLGNVRATVSSHEFVVDVRRLWAPLRWSHAEAAQLQNTNKQHACAHVRSKVAYDSNMCYRVCKKSIVHAMIKLMSHSISSFFVSLKIVFWRPAPVGYT